MILRWAHILVLLLWSGASFAQEVCNNGIDDDGDGLIDLNDVEDCPCSTVVRAAELQSYIRNHSFEEQMCCPYGFVAPPFTPPWLSCAEGWMQATAATSDYFHECGYAPAGMPLPPPDGEGAVGFYAEPGYFEYVGTCLTYPAPAHPLLAGTTYTLSLWIAAAVSLNNHSQTVEQADPSYFAEQLPLAIFGRANECVQFPIGTMGCIGTLSGWVELGRVMVQPSFAWTRVSITFTPTDEIHTVIIGGGCDVPASYRGMTITNQQGDTYFGAPYFLVDDLMLTVAQDQVLSPTVTSGNLCAGTAVANAEPPAGAGNYQWYRDGVALIGENSTTLGISAGSYGAGMYTMASQFNGECLMGSSYIPPPIAPRPWPSILPTEGCAPLTVAFADTTGGGTTTLSWSVGDGTARSDSAFVHTYTTPGSYDVHLRIRNGAGCEGDTVLLNAVVVHPAVSGGIMATPEPAEVENSEVHLTGSGTSDVVNWWWDLGAAEPGSSTDPSVTARFPPVAGYYPVMLVVSSANGCVDTVRSVVRVVEPGMIAMPNVFSPNGDGHNDRFVPLEYNDTPGLLEVYNRWGQMVFSTTALAAGWDGRASGGDVSEGTYFYIVTPDDEKMEAFVGHVTLVR